MPTEKTIIHELFELFLLLDVDMMITLAPSKTTTRMQFDSNEELKMFILAVRKALETDHEVATAMIVSMMEKSFKLHLPTPAPMRRYIAVTVTCPGVRTLTMPIYLYEVVPAGKGEVK
jgi:hypothetical protein